MEKKVNIPQKGAGRKWAARLKEIRQQPPPQDLVDKINKKFEDKKSAAPVPSKKDLDFE
jgi:hypothetical protein